MQDSNRWALVDANNIVEGIIIWDGDTNTWTPPSEFTIVKSDVANVGDQLNPDGTFTPWHQVEQQ